MIAPARNRPMAPSSRIAAIHAEASEPLSPSGSDSTSYRNDARKSDTAAIVSVFQSGRSRSPAKSVNANMTTVATRAVWMPRR